MAEVHTPTPEDLAEFLPDIDGGDCGFPSCMEFGAALLEKRTSPQKYPELNQEFGNQLASIVKLEKDPIPYNLMME